ncbi:MAG TPA: hypothetical protein VGQ93_11410 [Lysobacter sp.]|nr:hypothetical protein [Lysobacter sp.]
MKATTCAAIAVLTFAVSSNAFAQSVRMPRPVPYAETADIADNIKEECKLNEQLADFVQKYSKVNGVTVEFGNEPLDKTRGRVLDLHITNAISLGNAWTGHHKQASAVGTLYENGTKVASFKARRQSMGGAFAGYKGSCSVLGRTVDAMGEDIAAWLKAPVEGAKLGDD